MAILTFLIDAFVIFTAVRIVRNVQRRIREESEKLKLKLTQKENGETVETEAVVEEQAPAGVFAVDPFPDGWYPAEDGQPPVPIMGGALPPVEITENGEHIVTVIRTVFLRTGSGSGSGSYVTSYTTSYRTSYVSSGSGSYVFGSCTYLVGGYGLELV